MFKLRWIVLSMATMMLALVAFAGRANAQAARTSFTAIDAACSVTPGTQWVSGNVLHIRGEVEDKRIASADPMVNGSERAVVNVDLNLVTGSGNGWGTVLVRPDTINGTFTGTFSGAITADVFSGSGVAQGTGTLEGYTLMGTFQQIQPSANQPCAPAPALDADGVQGVILSTSH